MKDRRADDNFKNMRMKNECKAATLIANIQEQEAPGC